MTDFRFSRTVGWVAAAYLMALSGCGGADSSDDPAPVDAGTPAGDARGAELGGEIRGVDPEDREDAAVEQDDDHDAHASDEDHDDEMAGGQAHVHGTGELAAVLEGNDLTISLQAPLDSFGLPEAAPETDEQTALMDQARLKLQDPLGAVSLPVDAACIFSGSDVVFSYSGDHGEAALDYSFRCARPDALDAIEIRLFDTYDDLEEIDAVFIAGASQNAATLDASRTSLTRD